MKQEYLKCRLLSVDAWRDPDGWIWNNWYTLEEDIYIPENISDRALIKLFRDNLQVINDNSKGKVAIYDDGYNINLIARNTGEPLFALCYGEYL